MAVTLLVDAILESAERNAPRPAAIFDGGVISYRHLLALTSVAARMFDAKGVRPGDIVGVAMGQSPLHLVAILALARLGAVTLPQYTNLPPARRAHALERYGARWVVSDAAQPMGNAPVIPLRDLHARGDERDFSFTSFSPTADAPFRLALTSGTTGEQKAFMHTHGDFANRGMRRFGAGDAAPRVIPPALHITSALQIALHALATGGTVVFPHGNDARSFLAAIHLHAVTHVRLPPVDVAALLTLLPDDVPAFPSVRQLKIVGATPSAALVREARRKFSPNVAASYSMTEVGMVAAADAGLLEAHPGAAGRLVHGARLEVLGEDGRPVAAGESGEIRVAVEGMPRGYFGADASLPGFRDGWFHSGDRGHVTADGLVFIEGRNDSLLNIGGHKVASEYIESVLGDQPGVGEIAVFGSGDALLEMRVSAAVVPRGELDWRRLGDFARDRLGHSAPASYFAVESLPRNAMGKLERGALRDWVAARGRPVTT